MQMNKQFQTMQTNKQLRGEEQTFER